MILPDSAASFIQSFLRHAMRDDFSRDMPSGNLFAVRQGG